LCEGSSWDGCRAKAGALDAAAEKFGQNVVFALDGKSLAAGVDAVSITPKSVVMSISMHSAGQVPSPANQALFDFIQGTLW